MAIPHQEPVKKEEAKPEETSLPDVNLDEDSSIQQIKIDDQGNLQTMEELKKEVANFSVQIAEKLVSAKMEDSAAQQALIAKHLSDLTSNQPAA